MWHDLCAENPAKIFVDRGKKSKIPVSVYIMLSFMQKEEMCYLFLCASHSSKIFTHTYSFLPHNSIK